MRSKGRRAAAVAAAAVLVLAFLAWRLSSLEGVRVAASLPGMDGAPPGRGSPARNAGGGEAIVETSFVRYSKDDPGPVPPGEWPCFRGPERDGTARDAPALSDLKGPAPPVLWEVPLGEGYAGAAVSGGRVYVLDYLESGKADALRCFALSDGRELWRRSYPSRLKRNHGFSRTVPAVGNGYVVTIGPAGHVMCVKADSGELAWIRSLAADFGTKVPLWYAGQCPLIDGDAAVLAPGGTALLAGIRLTDGKVLWETPNPEGWEMSHSSVVRAAVAGRQLYLYATVSGLAAVEAEGEDRGAAAWACPDWKTQVMAPSPVLLPGDVVFLCAGYGAGSAGIEVSPGGPRLAWKRPPNSGLSSEQHTPVLFRGLLYGVMPADGGERHGQFSCVSPSGTVIWSSGRGSRFGLGSYIMADGKFFVQDDDGSLYAIAASTKEYVPLGSARLMEGKGVEAWAPMALAGSRLLLRDSARMLCVDLAAPSGSEGETP